MTGAAVPLEPDFVPIAQAAVSLGFTRASLYRFAAEGRLELVKREDRTGILVVELERFRAAITRPFVPGEQSRRGGRRNIRSAK